MFTREESALFCLENIIQKMLCNKEDVKDYKNIKAFIEKFPANRIFDAPKSFNLENLRRWFLIIANSHTYIQQYFYNLQLSKKCNPTKNYLTTLPDDILYSNIFPLLSKQDIAQLNGTNRFLHNKTTFFKTTPKYDQLPMSCHYAMPPRCINLNTDKPITALLTVRNFLISGLNDGTLEVWDINNGHFSHKYGLKKHSHPINALLALSRGRFASASLEGTLNIWDLVNGQYQCIQTLESSSASIFRFLITLPELPEGFASASEDGTIRMWDLVEDQYQCIKKRAAHSESIRSLRVLPNGHLAIISLREEIEIWSLKEDQLIQKFSGSHLQILSTGQLLVNSAYKIKILDLVQGLYEPKIIVHHEQSTPTIIPLPNGSFITHSKTFSKIWFLFDNLYECVQTFSYNNKVLNFGEVPSLTLPNGDIVMSSNNQIKVWRFPSLQLRINALLSETLQTKESHSYKCNVM